MTASERSALSRLANEEERRKKKKETKSTPSTIIKALLVVLLSRKFDYNPEHLLVSKSDIMASVKRS